MASIRQVNPKQTTRWAWGDDGRDAGACIGERHASETFRGASFSDLLTPVLSLLSGTPTGNSMLAIVWGGALIGIALKLFVPQHFGRLALILYAGIGWSGVVVFQSLADTLPPSTLWLLLAGGVAYSSGIIFHVWERLHFHNVLWHCFVVAGASLHLWAIFDCMVLRRL